MNETELMLDSARRLASEGKYDEAIDIYFDLFDGDPSFDAGEYAYQIASCYEKMGRQADAIRWYKVALRENPEHPIYIEVARRLDIRGR